MSDATAYMITDILKAVPRLNNVTGFTTDQFAMKTGTTNYDISTARKLGYTTDAAPDGWIVGYTPNITLAMWTGYIENKPGVYLTMNQMYSHRNALYRACGHAIFDNTGSSFTKPSSVVAVKVVKGTENLPSSATPSSMIITELFRRGYEPKTVTTKFDTLSNPSNLSLNFSSGTVTLNWNAAAKPKETDNSRGEFGYNIYLNGQLIGFTAGTSFTYSGSNPFGTYTVRTTYKNDTTSMSSGISKGLNQEIEFIANVEDTANIMLGESYTPSSSPFKVLENGVDVTSSASMSHTISGPEGTKDFSKPGDYTITYTVKYDGESDTAKTIVTVTGSEESTENENTNNNG